MQKTIFLSEVLKEMKRLDSENNPVPFQISVRCFTRKNFSGGKLLVFPAATLLQPPKQKGVQRLSDATPFKDANHWENRTRNIKDETGIHKINTLFITHFNGMEVIF